MLAQLLRVSSDRKDQGVSFFTSSFSHESKANFVSLRVKLTHLVLLIMPLGMKNVALRDFVSISVELGPWEKYRIHSISSRIEPFLVYTLQRSKLLRLSPCSHEDWNQMQSQEDEVAITEEDLELIKERETAIRQLEVRARSFFFFDSVYLQL